MSELAEALGAELTGGDPAAPILGIAGLDNVVAGQVIYVENERRQAEAERGPALALIAPHHLQPQSKPLLRVANPRLAFARALALLSPPRRLPPGVHCTAVLGDGVSLGDSKGASLEEQAIAAKIAIAPYCVIGDNCVIGSGVQIHSLVSVGRGVCIGADTQIYPSVSLYDGVQVGTRVIVHSGSVIGSDGFGYAHDGERHMHVPHIGSVIVEDDVEIGANVTIDRATTGVTVIGQGTKIDNLVQVAHNVKIGRHCLLAGQVGISGSVTIGDHVILAGQAGVTDHLIVGDGVQAGARAAIINDIPPGSIVWGYPARPRSEQLRIDAAMPRLPQLVRTVRELERRLKEIEERLRRSS